MPTMDHFKIFLVFVLVHHLSWPCLTQQVRKEIICPRYGRVDCSSSGAKSPSIRVVDVIYGRVVGLNKCGFTPTVNCTAPAYCEIAEKSNRRSTSDWFYPNYLKPDPCPSKDKYLIIKYRCLDLISLVGENFALKKPTFQSQIKYGGKPSKAVDGKTANRDYKACTHTAKETTPWWRVDLEQRIVVSHVRIFNRNNIGLRLCGFEIRIGDSIKNNGTTNARCGTLCQIPSDKYDVISCKPPLVGRYVTIVIPGKDKILTLCEVEVYGTGVLVPSGSPVNAQVKEVDEIGSINVAWSPPDIEKQNGKITNYSVCYSTATLTADCNNGSIVNTTATSITIKGLETATIYFFQIRAYTEVGPGPYTREINITTSSGPVEVAKNINITSSSYGVRLKQPRKGFSYIQVIVVKLKNKTKPSNFPNSYGKARISVVNESVGVSQPYVTAELSASQVKRYKDFVIGDGKNYRRLPSKRRRDVEELTTSFYNRPLEQNSFYSAFQRTFQDEDTYYSSYWAEPIRTAITGNGCFYQIHRRVKRSERITEPLQARCTDVCRCSNEVSNRVM